MVKKIIILIIPLFFFSCKKETAVQYVDFSNFAKHGWSRPSTKKFVTWINLRTCNLSSLNFFKDVYQGKISSTWKLDDYYNSNKVDVLFLVEASIEDSAWVKKALKDWPFPHSLLTYDGQQFFHPYRNCGGLSFIFDKDGKFIAETNPSMPNFKRLMND